MSEIVQGSQEWFAERLGIATASRFCDVLSKIKSGEAATRRNYRTQLLVERLTGNPAESFTNAAMMHGTEQEPFARMAYSAKTMNIVEETGFIRHKTLPCGCSPDGLVDDDGMIEIKSPYQTAVHLDTLRNGMPSEHKAQVFGQLWITGRQWVDFVSWDPRLPENLRLYVQRIERDEDYIAKLSDEVQAFMKEVEAEEAELRRMAA